MLGHGRVLVGATYIVASAITPGVIVQASAFRRIVFGEPMDPSSSRADLLATLLTDSGVDTTVTPDSRAAVWQKFVMQAPNASITSACQSSVGTIREVEEGAALYRRAIAEVAAVGRASGVALSDDAEDAAFAIVNSMPLAGKSSMQVDFERGRRVEVEELTGAVVRHGATVGAPTPTFDALYAVLKVRVETLALQPNLSLGERRFRLNPIGDVVARAPGRGFGSIECPKVTRLHLGARRRERFPGRRPDRGGRR